jgi:PAS domain S-box-containing protein
MLEEKNRLEIKTLLEGTPFLKQVLQNIKQAVWMLDLNTDRIVYVSPSFETVWGISCESFYSDPLTLIKSIHPEDRVKVLAASPDNYRTSLKQSYRIIRPDGNLRWISAQIFLIHEESAEASYQVCVAQDISDHNQVDQTLRKALDRSREQFTLSRRMSLARKPEAALRTLMSASELRTANLATVLFFDSPPSGHSREMDIVASWTSVPGLPPHIDSDGVTETRLHESNLFEDLALLDLFHPSNPVIVSDIPKDPRLTPAVRDLLHSAQIQTAAFFPMVTLGNWLGCLLIFFSQVKHFEPVELRHIKVLVDQATITLYNLQLLETEAESRHEAERANEIKTRFLAMISHELRTPLTSIKGFTTTLLAQDVTWEPEEQRDFIQTIEQEANRLQELIDHLLDLSRLDAGMLPITLENH